MNAVTISFIILQFTMFFNYSVVYVKNNIQERREQHQSKCLRNSDNCIANKLMVVIEQNKICIKTLLCLKLGQKAFRT